jgi:hypothetical protein
LKERDEYLVKIKERLVQAQQHYKLFYDCHHSKVEFRFGYA